MMGSNKQEGAKSAALPGASLAFHGSEGMGCYALYTFIYIPHVSLRRRLIATVARHNRNIESLV